MTKIRDFPLQSDARPAAAAGVFTFGNETTVNRMGYGAMRLTGEGIWGWPADRDNALKVLRRAVELGVQLIDTADAYGPDVNEEEIAQALAPYPKDVIVATKGGNTRPGPGKWKLDCRPERLKASCEASLRRLRLETIALYQIHGVDENVPWSEQVGALRDLRDAGKIRSVGLCNVTLDELREAETIVPIVSVQNRYNIAYRGESEIVIDYCERTGKAFLPWFPLGAGTDDIAGNTEVQIVAKAHGVRIPQIALAWLFARSTCIIPIPGTSSLQHLQDNVDAAALQLSAEDRVRLGIDRPHSTHHAEHAER
jgi:pyridoxine 4-dehydrogenase